MPRKRVWPPRPHPHRASGQERVWTGERHVYLGKIGSDEAKKNYADLLAKLAAAEPLSPAAKRKTGLAVGEVVERFQSDAKARYDPAGREAKQHGYAAAPLLDVHGKTPVVRFGCSQLEEVRDEMLRRGWSRGVINRRVIRLRTLFRWAERKALCPAGTWAGLRALEPLPRNDRRLRTKAPRRLPTWYEFARTCRFCPQNVRDMMLAQLFGGMRPAEVRTAVVGEFDRSGEDWVYRPAKHKNAWRGQTREVVLGPRARKVLAKHLDGKKPGELVFPSGRGGGYSDCTYPRAVTRACERAGVEPWAPYSLRHLAKQRATRAVGLDGARALLGQASILTTDRYAAGQDLKLAAEAAKRVG